MTKGFPGADVMSKIRFRPCIANVRLMKKRLTDFRTDDILIRRKIAEKILKEIPDTMKIGSENKNHMYWVLPIASRHSNLLIESLRKNGCDATTKASSLVKLQHEKIPDFTDELNLDNLVYLPIDSKIALILKKLSFDN